MTTYLCFLFLFRSSSSSTLYCPTHHFPLSFSPSRLLVCYQPIFSVSLCFSSHPLPNPSSPSYIILSLHLTCLYATGFSPRFSWSFRHFNSYSDFLILGSIHFSGTTHSAQHFQHYIDYKSKYVNPFFYTDDVLLENYRNTLQKCVNFLLFGGNVFSKSINKTKVTQSESTLLLMTEH